MKKVDISFTKQELEDLLKMVVDYRWIGDLRVDHSNFKRKIKYHLDKLAK